MLATLSCQVTLKMLNVGHLVMVGDTEHVGYLVLPGDTEDVECWLPCPGR